MALDGPQLVYTRKEEQPAPAVARALELAREVEELLEETASTATVPAETVRDAGAHSTRIVRAMAASLVDELEALVRGTRRSGVA